MPNKSENIAKIIEPHIGETGGPLAALRAIQSDIGYLPEDTDTLVADAFNISRAEVKGIVSFYEDFTRTPKGELVIRVCAAEACQAVGGRELIHAAQSEFGVQMGETSPSGSVTLEPVYCLGLCSAAPAAMVGGRLVGKADVDRLRREAKTAIKDEAS